MPKIVVLAHSRVPCPSLPCRPAPPPPSQMSSATPICWCQRHAFSTLLGLVENKLQAFGLEIFIHFWTKAGSYTGIEY